MPYNQVSRSKTSKSISYNAIIKVNSTFTSEETCPSVSTTNTTYTFTLQLDGILPAGTYEGDFFVGPAAAPTAIEVPVTFVSTLELIDTYVPLIFK